MNIDWELFKQQKNLLIALAERVTDEEMALIDGVINMMDAIQDQHEPEELL